MTSVATEAQGAGSAHNPFCSARVCPGAIPFLLPPDITPASLLVRLRELGGKAQLIGPEGVGKSALLATLAQCAREQGRAVHTASAKQPAGLLSLPADTMLFLDTAELLDRMTLWRLRRRVTGLLVTCHRQTGLPTLWRHQPDAAMFARIVDHLLQGWDCAHPTQEMLAAVMARHNNNVRLALFELYDWYETNA